MMNPVENTAYNAHRTEETRTFLLTNIQPMPNHPFKVRDDENMTALVESIRLYGVLNPIIVRKAGGSYEIVSVKMFQGLVSSVLYPREILFFSALNSLMNTVISCPIERTDAGEAMGFQESSLLCTIPSTPPRSTNAP